MFKILVLVYKAENGFHSFILFLSGETVLKIPNRTDGFHLQIYFFKNTREIFISHPHYHKGTFFFG